MINILAPSVHRDKTAIYGQVCFQEQPIADSIKHGNRFEAVGLPWRALIGWFGCVLTCSVILGS